MTLPNAASDAFVMVQDAAGLEPVLELVRAAHEIAIDTEADNLYRYQTRVCLMQVHVSGRTFLIDLLSEVPVEKLLELLRDKHLIMHGSDYDLRLLFEAYRFVPTSLFDTLFAAQALGIVGCGLASLLMQHFEVVLPKDSQKANWSIRPLPEKMLHYAARDVYYLIPLRDQLLERLKARKRIDWVNQKCRRQIASALSGFPKPDANSWRIGPADRYPPRAQAMLYCLWHWREKQAEFLDVPPFKVVGNEFLFQISEAALEGHALEALDHARLGKRERLRESLFEAVKQGIDLDPLTLPARPPRGSRSPLTRMQSELSDTLIAVRDRFAAEHEIDPTHIASRMQITQIARQPWRCADVLLPWQAAVFQTVEAVAKAVPPPTPSADDDNGESAEA